MTYEQMETHKGHRLQIADNGGSTLALSCVDCDAVIEEQAKIEAEARWTQNGDKSGPWLLKVENGPQLEAGTTVLAKRSNGTESKEIVGELVDEAGGNYPGRIYAVAT